MDLCWNCCTTSCSFTWLLKTNSIV
jgi:hypothetical protein